MSMLFPRNARHKALKVLACITCLVLASLSACFNPTFVNQVSGGAVVPLAPGDTPFVHVLVINATAYSTLDFQFGWTPQFQGYNTGFVSGITPQQQQGFLLGCPVERIGLGDPADLTSPAVIVSGPTGLINVPPSAFPLILQRGRDFECGDTVVFTVVDDQTNGYGIEILPGHVLGTGQVGPFTGPDTFEIVDALLLGAGSPPIPIP